MRLIPVYLIILLLSFQTMCLAQSTVPYLSGLPVMPSFVVAEDSIMVFDKPQGQIVEISLSCENNCPSQQQAMSYYHDVLVKLGWLYNGTTIFIKDTQTLQISYSAVDKSSGAALITFYSEI